MPRLRKPPAEDDGPSMEWMVTFSDCMTLLLCFFVMLLAFSSFDEATLGQIRGAFRTESNPSALPLVTDPRPAVVPPVPRPLDRTEQGADQPTDRIEPTMHPKPPLEELLPDDAYADERILTIPSELLFWAEGSHVRPEGQALLDRVAEYITLVPSRVVVSETGPDEGRGLQRAWSVADRLSERGGLDPARFSIAVPSAGDRDAGAQVRIAILNPRVFP